VAACLKSQRGQMSRRMHTRASGRRRGAVYGPGNRGVTRHARGPQRGRRNVRTPATHMWRRVAGTVATSLAREREPDARVLVLFHLPVFEIA
jgi:hypothetical protein